MFRKTTKKIYPPGTFIPTPARLMAILQLCLAFSLLLWQASQPFMGDLFRTKSEMLIYQDVMGIPPVYGEVTQRLNDNEQRFANLPRQLKSQIENRYLDLQSHLNTSFKEKISKLSSLFFKELSPFELAWIFFSIVISILLLKKVEGASHAVWILPLLTLLFAIHNHSTGIKNKPVSLFPSEELIVKNYLFENLDPAVSKQYAQLLKGWQQYLIIEWANEIPSSNKELFKSQAEKGEFYFNLAQIQQQQTFPEKTSNVISTWVLCLYCFWNFMFAWIVSRTEIQHLKPELKVS
jgi:hypothetical protein